MQHSYLYQLYIRVFEILSVYHICRIYFLCRILLATSRQENCRQRLPLLLASNAGIILARPIFLTANMRK